MNIKYRLSNKKDRIIWMDLAKGIAIILVIFGHCVHGGIRGIIFSFHMPLFFILSGMTYKRRESYYAIVEYCLKGFKQLIVPSFIVFSICFIDSLIRDVFMNRTVLPGEYFTWKLRSLYYFIGSDIYVNEIMLAPRVGVIWFLLALFLVRIIFTFILCINNKILKAVVAGNTFKFGEYFNDDGMYMEPEFADICVDSEGIVTVIERLNGKVYQYDQDGRMLVAFGGTGQRTGTFTRTAAIDVDSAGRLWILDRISCNIQVFEPTEFIQLVHAATSAYNDGDYTTSYDLWRRVLAIDENYDLAHVGIARAYYKQGEYKLAMEECELVGDRDTYTMAFDEYKYVVLRQYFVLIVFLAVVIIAAVIILFSVFKKYAKKCYWNYLNHKEKKMGIGQGIMYSFYTLLHPIDTLEGIRYNRARINMAVPFILMITAYIARMAYLYIVHFPLAYIELGDVNPVFEAVKLWIVPISWIPASFMATSISGGESKMREITFTSALSLVPFIVINTPLMFLSRLLSKSQQSWYGVFSALAYLGMFLIMLLTMMILNNYTLKKTIGMMFVSAFLMLVLWLVILLCYILTGRMIQFVIGIGEESRLNFL